jgi:putative oxidoreductase
MEVREGSERVGSWAQRMLSVFRIVVAALFIEHGTQKLFNMPPGPGPFPATSLMGVAALIELTCGTLLLFGFLTRIAAFVAAGEMAVAYFMVHAPKSPFPAVNLGEPAILNCFAFLYFVCAGAGAWSLDALIARRDPGSQTQGNKLSGRGPASPVRGT